MLNGTINLTTDDLNVARSLFAALAADERTTITLSGMLLDTEGEVISGTEPADVLDIDDRTITVEVEGVAHVTFIADLPTGPVWTIVRG
jgi:hypothetical protein